MNPATHFLTGWLIANLDGLSKKERALVTLAGVVPDLDGLGIVAELATRDSAHPLLWWSMYHHVFGHNLPFGLVLAGAAWALATRRWITAGLVLLSFHLHLLGDLLGARGPDGYQWPIPYFYPFFRSVELKWSGQWALDAWPNTVLTLALLAATLFLAVQRGFSPLEMISGKADRALVDTLKRRFSK